MTRDEILKGPINEPSDAGAPIWAEWKAQRSDGKWFWYEHRPVRMGSGWYLPKGYRMCQVSGGRTTAIHGWQNTLKRVKHKRIDAPEVWDGREWPPPDTVCEYKVKKSWVGLGSWRWNTCQILSYHDRFVWMDIGASRPITSPVDGLCFRLTRRGAKDMARVLRSLDYGLPDAELEEISDSLIEAIRDGKVPGIRVDADG